MIVIIFLCVMKSHLFAMFLRNSTTISLSIAEILLSIKRWSKIAVANTCVLLAILKPCQYWRQRLRNFCVNENKMVISREDRMLIKVLQQSSRLWDLGPATGACLPLKNSWRQPLDGATDRGVVQLDHIICVAVNQWRTRLLACVHADEGHFEHQL